jgi:hypothetical protein
MSKITVEQITNAAKEACNSFPYFKHGFSATPPHDITEDLDAAIKFSEQFPNCFDTVSCDTSNNIVGTFKFTGHFNNEENSSFHVYVDHIDALIRGRPNQLMMIFLHLYSMRAPVEPVVTYNDVVQRNG